jgi:hypothetical protein
MQRFAVREVSSWSQLYESEADSLYETLQLCVSKADQLLSAQLTIQHVFEAGLFVKRLTTNIFGQE